MKKFAKIFAVAVTVILVPGILTALIVFYIAKILGFKIDFEKFKKRIRQSK